MHTLHFTRSRECLLRLLCAMTTFTTVSTAAGEMHTHLTAIHNKPTLSQPDHHSKVNGSTRKNETYVYDYTDNGFFRVGFPYIGGVYKK